MDPIQLATLLLTPALIASVLIGLALQVGTLLVAARVVAGGRATLGAAFQCWLFNLLLAVGWAVVCLGGVMVGAAIGVPPALLFVWLVAGAVALLVGMFAVPMHVFGLDFPPAVGFLAIQWVLNLVLGGVSTRLTGADQELVRAMARPEVAAVVRKMKKEGERTAAARVAARVSLTDPIAPAAAAEATPPEPTPAPAPTRPGTVTASDHSFHVGPRAELPTHVKVTRTLEVRLRFEGGGDGVVEVPKGTELELLGVHGDKLEIRWLDRVGRIPRDRTDY